MTPKGTDERLDAMQATIDELRAELAALRDVAVQYRASDPQADEEPVSRRHALRVAGVMAAGAIAGGAGILAGATPAAAVSGTFDASGSGQIALQAGGSNGATGLYANSDSDSAVRAESLESTAVSAAGEWGIEAQGTTFGIVVKGLKAPVFIRPNGLAPQTRGLQYLCGQIVLDVYGDLWMCVNSATPAGAPGKHRKITGPGTAGAFHPLTPGRVHDSRIVAGGVGPITRGQTRTVSVANRIVNGATPALSNFVPEGATAVTLNVTIAATVGSGYLAVNPGGDSVVHASTINWSSGGLRLANSTVVAVNASREVTVIGDGAVGSSTEFIIDVLGYWM